MLNLLEWITALKSDIYKMSERAQRILSTQAWAQLASRLGKCKLLLEFIVMTGFITIIVIGLPWWLR